MRGGILLIFCLAFNHALSDEPSLSSEPVVISGPSLTSQSGLMAPEAPTTNVESDALELSPPEPNLLEPNAPKARTTKPSVLERGVPESNLVEPGLLEPSMLAPSPLDIEPDPTVAPVAEIDSDSVGAAVLPPSLLCVQDLVPCSNCDECSTTCRTTCATASPPWGLSFADMFPWRSEDPSLAGVCIEPTLRRNWSLIGLFGYETFRGVADNGWQTNGVYGGFNFGSRLGGFSDWTGIGVQGGVTTGLYDWKGNAYRQDTTRKMQQTFVTYGLFKRATERSPLTLAVAQDWMTTENATAYGLSLAISQIRYRFGYATSSSNEFGVLGAFRVVDDTTSGVGRGGSMPTTNETVTTRPLNHASAYWHHKWSANGGNTIISLGSVEDGRVSGDGSLGDFLATATVNVPLSNTVGFVGNIMYMNPTASPGFDASHEDTWSFLIGVEFFPGRDARSTTIAGERWMPLLPVANNGAFLLDAAAI